MRSRNLRIRLDDLLRLHPQCFERLQLCFQHWIFGNAVRVQLEVDPFVDAQPPDLLDIARTRSEGQPVQHLQDLLVLGEFRVEGATGTSQKGRRMRARLPSAQAFHHAAPPRLLFESCLYRRNYFLRVWFHGRLKAGHYSPVLIDQKFREVPLNLAAGFRIGF